MRNLITNGFGTVYGRLFVGTAEKIPSSQLVGITSVRDAIIAAILYRGPYWSLPLGRRDSLTSNSSDNQHIPSPFEPLENITAKFISKGLDMNDMVVLSGGHTIGFAQCFTFK
ncbi:hypothetical protein Nepgr_022055 [Nepenthes gracilis]|uniref:peroxidase n=1 Tax=Nepenthes gracilis TaxID=150966 RepID=A0AAD3T020_NEPGR|nr:hypothetical protein Nepgr_022055 [Nepenthes gracilis]